MPKILVVEDKPLSQKITKLLLELKGYTVDIAASGQEALCRFNAGYDLILMDIGLPDICGIELTKEIRKQETNYHIPIIGLTGVDSSYQHKCLSSGMNDFLMKPINADDLNETLLKFIQSPPS